MTMTDLYDRASAHEEQERQRAIAHQRAQGQGPDISNLHCIDCIDCTEPIAPERRAAVRNCRRCIDCQKIAEARQQLTR